MSRGSSESWTESFVDEELKEPNLAALEEAPFEAFGDIFDVLNDGTGADFKTASHIVYLNIDEGIIIIPKVRFNYEHMTVWGTLEFESPLSILRYKVSSESSLQEVAKWIEWACSKDEAFAALSADDIRELLE